MTQVIAALKQELVETKERIEHLRDAINDLVLIVRLYHNGYTSDENHITKQKDIVDRACEVAELPKTMDDVAKHLDEKCPGWR